MQKILKSWGLPIAMITGTAGYKLFALFTPAIPYMIFVMLLITYCRISWKSMKIMPLHMWLLAIQLIGGMVVYWTVSLIDPLVAQGTFICILAPTATAAAVITGMLGGSITTLATYTLISNLAVAVASPIVFSFIGIHVELPFWESFAIIARQMGPMLILPLAGAWLLYKFLPRVHEAFQNRQNISFYLWLTALTIMMGRTVSLLVENEQTQVGLATVIALGTLVICVVQFVVGRRIGRKYRETVAGGQGLGQKNTVLAIWMSGIYLDPMASIGPTAYILWQNLVNSYQLWRSRSRDLNA